MPRNWAFEGHDPKSRACVVVEAKEDANKLDQRHGFVGRAQQRGSTSELIKSSNARQRQWLRRLLKLPPRPYRGISSDARRVVAAQQLH
jgi:hypothetical protein